MERDTHTLIKEWVGFVRSAESLFYFSCGESRLAQFEEVAVSAVIYEQHNIKQSMFTVLRREINWHL